MKLRTEIHIPKSIHQISHSDTILSIGSCFSDTIAEILARNKFDILANPFGNIYNPHSIFKQLSNSLGNTLPEKKSYIYRDGIYLNDQFHSDTQAQSIKEYEQKLTTKFIYLNHYLKTSDWILITFGSSKVYKRKITGQIVSNCHKLPQKDYETYYLQPDEIYNQFNSFYKEINKINPKIKFLLTISPVRYTKDDLPSSNLSKSILKVSCKKIITEFENAFYFPSYEILIDDLRDYRFYKPDLIHPNEIAVDYIFELFKESFLDLDAKKFLTSYIKIRKSLLHKPGYIRSEAYKVFLEKILDQIDKNKYSEKLSEEKNLIYLKLNTLLQSSKLTH